MKPEDFEGRAPRFALEDFFAGHSRAWGIFQDRFGTLRQQFHVEIRGEWQDGTLVLTEDFAYDDGKTDQRVWTIRKLDEHHYRASAGDILGEARVKAYGNAVNLAYRMRIPIAGKTWILDFDDWMFRQDQQVVINRATVSKWGLLIGTATVVFQKDAAAARAPEHGAGAAAGHQPATGADAGHQPATAAA